MSLDAIKAAFAKPLVALAFLFVLAAGVRSVRYSFWPGVCMAPAAETNEIARIGHSLASHGTFADPYGIPTGPTAHHAPIYPLLLASIYRCAPPAAWIPLRVYLNILLASLTCAAVYWTATGLGLTPKLGAVAAGLLAIAPTRLAIEICNDQEADLVALLAVISVGATARWFPSHPLQLGILWGVTLLAAPVLLPVVLIGIAVSLARGADRRIALALIATLLVLAPWIIRNRYALGGWFFVRDNLGLELRVSNADDAVADWTRNAERGAMQLYHPLFNRDAVQRVASFGERREFARLGSDAVAWIAAHPSRFAALTAERIRNLWLPLGTSRRQLLWRITLWALAVVGIVRLILARSFGTVALLGSVLVLYPLPYYLVQSYERYAYPVEWAVTLLAVCGASFLWGGQILNNPAAGPTNS